MATIIETKNLTHRYGKLTAVNDVTLEIEQGSIFGFIGPNGAGKTTMMRILCTLLRPTSGDAWIGGCSVRKDPRGVRRQIGYMPDFFGVYDEMKVWEYLDFFASCYEGGQLHRGGGRQRSGLIDDLLQLVDLAHRRNDYVDSLSRGMKQRLCLARTLTHDPQVLILDEPASGLDPRARIEIRELLRELQAMGKTIFFSSHILLEVAEVCTTVGIVEAGVLVAHGTLDEVARGRGATRRVRIAFAGRTDHGGSGGAPAAGAADVAAALLGAMPGVIHAEIEAGGGRLRGSRKTEIVVDFRGDDAAQAAILNTLMEARLPVISFQEEKIDLEAVFMQRTRGLVT